MDVLKENSTENIFSQQSKEEENSGEDSVNPIKLGEISEKFSVLKNQWKFFQCEM